MNTLAKRLAESARKNGICKEWGDRLAGCTDDQIDKMMIMYVKGIDFCLKNDWPDLETARKFFKGRIEHHGVHVDETCTIKNAPFNVLLGASDAAISFDQYSVGQIYIRHTSKAKIDVSDHSFVRLDVYETQEVEINASGNAKISIKTHNGGDVRINKSGDAVVKLNQKQM